MLSEDNIVSLLLLIVDLDVRIVYYLVLYLFNIFYTTKIIAADKICIHL